MLKVELRLILGSKPIKTLVILVCFNNKEIIPGKKQRLILGYNIQL
jgi:hypothetical protein